MVAYPQFFVQNSSFADVLEAELVLQELSGAAMAVMTCSSLEERNLYIRIHIVLHMVSKIVPVRLKEQELKQIDQLVEHGVFGSRSEAIRELIKLGIENLSQLFEVSRALEKLFELEKIEGKTLIDLSGATEQLLEERRR
ncbi:MAG: ribbon-helix-helix domain-containing protein [Candidatus Methanodesulfokora sp.]